MLSALLPATYTSRFALSGSVCLLVAQQHLALGDRPAGDRAVRLAADLVDVGAVGQRVLEEAEVELRGEDPRRPRRRCGPSETSPSSTSWVSVGMNSSQPLGLLGAWIGSMNMSTPALTEASTWAG